MEDFQYGGLSIWRTFDMEDLRYGGLLSSKEQYLYFK